MASKIIRKYVIAWLSNELMLVTVWVKDCPKTHIVERTSFGVAGLWPGKRIAKKGYRSAQNKLYDTPKEALLRNLIDHTRNAEFHQRKAAK